MYKFYWYNRMMLKAVIYDMDGVLIDSEPLWKKAEISSFSKINIKLTEEMCKETMGMRVDEGVTHWFQKFNIKSGDGKYIEDQIWANIIRLTKEEGKPKPGVIQSLDFFKNQKVKLALASTSAMILINTVIDKLRIREYFEVIHSAEYEINGKPHPDVYISTAKKLGIHTNECVAIEDSFNGIIAAKAAKMKCIAIPEKEFLEDKRLGIADLVLSSLTEINSDCLVKLKSE